MSPARNYVLVIALALGAYVGSFYLLPRRLGGGFPPPAKVTWVNVFYNGFFYPMRWATGRLTQSYPPATVQSVDFEKRQVFIMLNHKNVGYYLRFRRRDEATIRSLQVGDRIRVTVENLPHLYSDTSYAEFRSFSPVQ